jgi:hypothetical protein
MCGVLRIDGSRWKLGVVKERKSLTSIFSKTSTKPQGDNLEKVTLRYKG